MHSSPPLQTAKPSWDRHGSSGAKKIAWLVLEQGGECVQANSEHKGEAKDINKGPRIKRRQQTRQGREVEDGKLGW